ncbi:hypothetical protein LSAT2_006034, partial [Lamellibrachia satsuma]
MSATSVLLLTAAVCLAVTEAGKFGSISSGGYQVCGNRHYNPRYSVCCGYQVLYGTTSACCGYRGYDTRYALCCGWRVVRRPWTVESVAVAADSLSHDRDVVATEECAERQRTR